MRGVWGQYPSNPPANMGDPPNPYPYLRKTRTCNTGTGFHGYGLGSLLNDPGVTRDDPYRDLHRIAHHLNVCQFMFLSFVVITGFRLTLVPGQIHRTSSTQSSMASTPASQAPSRYPSARGFWEESLSRT